MDALNTLIRLGSGHFIEDLAARLQEVSDEVVASGNPGAVTVSFTISRPRGAGDAVVTIEESIAKRPPRSKPRGAMFYAVDGGLHGNDPRQATLQLHAVDTGPGELQHIDTAAAPVRTIGG